LSESGGRSGSFDGIHGNGNLKRLSRTRIARTLDANDPSPGEHLKFLPGTNVPRNRNAERRHPSADGYGTGSRDLTRLGGGGLRRRLGIDVAATPAATPAAASHRDARGDFLNSRTGAVRRSGRLVASSGGGGGGGLFLFAATASAASAFGAVVAGRAAPSGRALVLAFVAARAFSGPEFAHRRLMSITPSVVRSRNSQ